MFTRTRRDGSPASVLLGPEHARSTSETSLAVPHSSLVVPVINVLHAKACTRIFIVAVLIVFEKLEAIQCLPVDGCIQCPCSR